MTDNGEAPVPKSVRDAASDWLVRLDKNPSPQVKRELAAWLEKNPTHARAYDEVYADWDEGQLLSGSHLHTRELVRAPFLMRRSTHIAGAGLGIAAVLSVTSVLMLPSGGPFPLVAAAQAATYETVTGEIRSVVLADGSKVTLDTNTRLTVSLTSVERRVRLGRGRARFEVKSDRARPFIVDAKAGEVVARATIFDVSVTGNNARVVLLKGSLDVRDNTRGTAITLQKLNLGYQVEIGGGAPPVRASVVEARWVSGMLALDATPLADAVAAINRYNRIQVRLADNALARLPVTGAFRVLDPAGFANAIAAMYDLRVERTNGAITLRARSSSSLNGTAQK